MTTQEILSASKTKTWKIEQLLRLGKTRQAVADLVGTNYGFVQNVYKRIFPERVRIRQTIAQVINEFTLTNFEFNHKFGIEIEAFGLKKSELIEELTAAGISVYDVGYSTSNSWKIVSDASIVGENAFELVSPILQGKDGLRQLKTVSLIVKALEAKVNRTCGMHIHFDATYFNLKTFRNIFVNYSKLESEIDSFMPESRRGNSNRFCKSLTEFENNIKAISDNSTTLDGLNAINRITGNTRYLKINIQSYWRQKSIEFRQHSSTVKFEKIQNWILFLARMIEFSKHAQLETGNWNSFKRFLPNEMIQYFAKRKSELN
jgi:hypothetical protein